MQDRSSKVENWHEDQLILLQSWILLKVLVRNDLTSYFICTLLSLIFPWLKLPMSQFKTLLNML